MCVYAFVSSQYLLMNKAKFRERERIDSRGIEKAEEAGDSQGERVRVKQFESLPRYFDNARTVH